MTDAKFIKLDRGLVSIAGADRRTLLQGLISQDVDRITSSQASYGAFLTPQGKYLHDFCLAEIGDRLILDGEQGRGEELIERIKRFKLRAKVELSVADGLSTFAVFGENVPAALGLADTPGAARPFGEGTVFVDPRAAELGCRLIVPTTDTAAILTELPAIEGTPEDYEVLRIGLGVPDGTRDMDVEKSILLECNFETLNGVDWDKGCYIGQEVTARTKYRGLVKRQLVAVSIDGETPAPGSAIHANGKKVGEIRSVQDEVAIASLRLDALNPGDSERSLTANGAIITPLAP
ncbi:MAG: folate-binding protein [Alphaproteobacteria bacterium]|nr:folate-binding protein [Alphaproteobacteria bacterium]